MSGPEHMQNKAPTQQPAPQISVADIYYVLFKHKWMILAFSVVGIAAAATIYSVTKVPYESEAKLLVRFVQDETVPVPGTEKDPMVKPLDVQGVNTMNNEVQIITSLDVLAAVVDAIGVQKFLGKNSGNTNRELAAFYLRRNLVVDVVPKHGNVLSVSYSSTDPQLAQQVVRQLIDSYFKAHVEFHRAPGVLDDFLTQQTDRIRTKLAQTEEELRLLKAKANVVSLEDTQRNFSQESARLRQEIFAAEVELEERQTSLKAMEKLAGTNEAAKEPAPEAVAESPKTNATAVAVAKVPQDLKDDYRSLNERLSDFRKREREFLKDLQPENRLVQEIRGEIATLVEKRKEMEAKEPRLLDEDKESATAANDNAARPSSPPASSRSTTPANDIGVETTRVAALQARIRKLTEQFDKLKKDAMAVDEVENQIVQLQRKKELEEKQFRDYSSSVEKQRLDAALAAGKLSNISEIQTPSLPIRDTRKLRKTVMMAAGGGVGAGLGLAFLLEFILLQTVRKPQELETRYRLPVFLSIPQMELGGKQRPQLTNGAAALNGHQSEEATENGDLSVAPVNGGFVREIAPWDEKHCLHPYSEALRDRLVTFFETRNMNHKPKLIAITSCSQGAGVTTLAAGLAASLSETGEGNVLLVDMNIERGAAHPFYKGKPACGLADVLNHENRDAAMVQDNLYLVSGNGAGDLPRILPKQFMHLIPKLQSSDYDYIIFDMPPISQTSVTPRLAGFMDMVFLIVEAEKTGRERVRQATELLEQSKANLGAVLNKRRNYVPQWLHQDF